MLEELDQKTEKTNLLTSPLLYGFLLVLLLGAGVFYMLKSQQKELAADEATTLVKNILAAKGPSMIHFHVGVVKPSVDEKPGDPHYLLLQKAGIITVAKGKEGAITVGIPAEQEQRLKTIADVKTWKNPDDTIAYAVPLATRELLQVTAVTMTSPNVAKVEYTWKWNPNYLGDVFDANSKLVEGFNRWHRLTLIDKYGVDFYKETEPKKGIVVLSRNDQGWRIAPVE